MKKLVVLLFTFPLAVSLSMPVFARSARKRHYHYKEHAYYGNISDSNSGAHYKMLGNPRQRTLERIKHGAKYVFVYRGKVFMITNQNMPGLEKYAGEHVRIMGTRTPDGKGITIASIRAARRRKKKAKAKG